MLAGCVWHNRCECEHGSMVCRACVHARCSASCQQQPAPPTAPLPLPLTISCSIMMRFCSAAADASLRPSGPAAAAAARLLSTATHRALKPGCCTSCGRCSSIALPTTRTKSLTVTSAWSKAAQQTQHTPQNKYQNWDSISLVSDAVDP